ncbi:Protein_disulfide isomerase PDI4 [Hexamita inflata]|uniref:Protein disulfide isomerase PDI4 n=1 Tax=Hexamita inflata TaxID=28002 RepID=A0AA86P2E0_9EUKA|nr:Protein disulfide isomerase PDI4 [Hexamita inflata]
MLFQLILSDVLKITDDNYAIMLAKNPRMMLKMYAPWCGHCKELAPIYQEVSNTYSGVKLAEVDCTESASVCQKFAVEGYPTIKLLMDGQVHDYNRERKAADITDWLDTMTGPVLPESTSEELAVKFHMKNYFVLFGTDSVRQQFDQYLKNYLGKVNLGFVYSDQTRFVAFKEQQQIKMQAKFSQTSVQSFVDLQKYDFLPTLQQAHDQTKGGKLMIIICDEQQKEELKNQMQNILIGDQSSTKYKQLEEMPIAIGNATEKFYELFDPVMTAPYALVITGNKKTYNYKKVQLEGVNEIMNEHKKLLKAQLVQADEFEMREKKLKRKAELEEEARQLEQERLEKLRRIQDQREGETVKTFKLDSKIIYTIVAVVVVFILILICSFSGEKEAEEDESKAVEIIEEPKKNNNKNNQNNNNKKNNNKK